MNKHLLYYFLYLFIGANINFFLWKKYSCNNYNLGVIFGCLMTLSWIEFYKSRIRK